MMKQIIFLAVVCLTMVGDRHGISIATILAGYWDIHEDDYSYFLEQWQIRGLMTLLVLCMAGCGTFGAMGDAEKRANETRLLDVRLHGRPPQLQQFDLGHDSYSKGVAYAGAKQYDQALQAFNEAIRLNPNLAVAFCGRGHIYVAQNAYERALQDYDVAIRLNPNLAEAFYGRGNVYVAQNLYERALQDYDVAISLKPNLPEAFYERGSANLGQNAYDRAIENFDQAIALNPKHAEAFYERGSANLGQNAYDRAIENFDQAIALNPKIGKAYFRRGAAQFDRGQFLSSVADFEQAVQLEPTNAYIAIRLYLAQSRTGQDGLENLTSRSSQLDLKQWPGPVVSMYLGTIPSQAVLEAALDKDPKKQRHQECEAYFYIGEHNLLQGKQEDAVRMFRAAIESNDSAALTEVSSAKAELHRIGL